MHCCENLRFDTILPPRSVMYWMVLSLTLPIFLSIFLFLVPTWRTWHLSTLKGISHQSHQVEILCKSSMRLCLSLSVRTELPVLVLSVNLLIIDINNVEHWAKDQALWEATSDLRLLWFKSPLCCLILNQFTIHWCTWQSSV